MFKLKKKVLHEMPLVVLVPVDIPLHPVGRTTGNEHDLAALLNPFYKLGAIIPPVGEDKLSLQVERFQKLLCKFYIVAVPVG